MLSGWCWWFCCFIFSVFHPAQGIQEYVAVRFEHEHEHIRQSSALSVVREASNNRAFPILGLLPLLYMRATVSLSSSSAATPCPYSAS